MDIRHLMVVLAAVLMTACGTPAPGTMTGQSDASVTMDRDGGMPPVDVAIQPDTSPLADSPSADVPTPPDVPAAEAGDSGPPVEPFLCRSVLCGPQNVFYYEGGMDTTGIDCQSIGTSGMIRAQLRSVELADGWTECRGNECSSMMEGMMVRRVLRYTMTGGRCSSCADILDFSPSGSPMTRTSGVRQICRRE